MVRTGSEVIHVLLVEAAEDDGPYRQALADTRSPFHIEHTVSLGGALERLRAQPVDIVLLGLELPDAAPLEAVDRVVEAAPDSLVLILCDGTDEETARRAVARGAHDFFSRSCIDTYWLPKALRHAVSCKIRAEELCQSVEWYREMNDASTLGILISDTHGRCIYTNPAYQRMSGLSLEASLGDGWLDSVHPEDRATILHGWPSKIHNLHPLVTEFRFLHADGREVWARLSSAAMHDGKKLHGYMQTVEDISEARQTQSLLEATEEALFEEKERAQVTLNSIGDGVICTDRNQRVSFLNRAAERMTGWKLEEAAGRGLDEVFHLVDTSERQACVQNGDARTLRCSRLVPRNAAPFPIEDSISPIHDILGADIGKVIVFRDVSEAHEMAARMAYLAQHDYLTDLPNRMLLNDRLRQAISLAQRHHHKLAVLFLDLDHFKHINDSLGHSVGDRLLQQVAARLKSCIRSADTLCRQGGDEFVVLLSEVDEVQDAAQVAAKMLETFACPVSIESHDIYVGLSIGISLYPEDGSDADTVIKNADIAMYHAKENGRNNYQFFTPELNVRAMQRHALKRNLHRAITRNEFLLHYQSKIDLETGQLRGIEALLRWHHPEQGYIEPARFVPIAEDCGLIGPIGQWVLREACGQVHSWQAAGLPVVPVSVNISAAEFRNRHFIDNLAGILEETGLEPQLLELELTEGIMLQDTAATTEAMHSLKDMGIRLSIDDFGTGYSNLSALKRFPIDTLKIDRSFVQDITTDLDDATIVRAIVNIARSLNMRAIAEGVETPAHLAFLQALQCDEGQGYFFGRPVRASAFEQLLGDGKPLASPTIASSPH